jgi:hypothetical protein
MGSIIEHIECPNCEHEAFSDFYYKTGEEYVNCSNCGYHYSATIKDRTKLISELTEDDYEIVYSKDPYGAYKIKMYEGVGYTCGSLGSEEQLNELKSELEESIHAGVEIEYFQVSRFIDGQIKVETIIDNGPKTDSAGFTDEDRFEGDDEEEYFI